MDAPEKLGAVSKSLALKLVLNVLLDPTEPLPVAVQVQAAYERMWMPRRQEGYGQILDPLKSMLNAIVDSLEMKELKFFRILYR